MNDSRQLPLFSSQPTTPAELAAQSRLRDTITLFQTHLQREGKSDHTINAFTADLQLLADWGGDEIQIGQYTTTTLNEFLQWLEFGRGIPCSRKSYARRVTTLKVFFKWLTTLKAIPHDPANAVLQRSGAAPLANILTPTQIEAALSFAVSLRRGEKPDARPELLVRLLVDTAIKKGETANLTHENIERNVDGATLIVRHKNAKNIYKERRILLTSEWLRVYDEYLAQYPIKEAIFTCSARNLEYILEDVGVGAGIEHKLSFEMMRWTSAVRDYRQGIEPDEIRDKLGLSKISWVETFDKIKRLTEQQLTQEKNP